MLLYPTPAVLLCVAAMLFAAPASSQEARPGPEDFRSRASFELLVESSPVLPTGTTRITAPGAYVAKVRGLAPGNSDGLEILFLPQAIDAAGQADILRNDARQLKKGRYAALVIFLDKDRKPGQVNLSYVVPGATVMRTVAWKPDDLKQWAAGFRFDGKRVVFRNKGRFTETGPERFTLGWDVDVDLPVVMDKQR
jgi:hypothetical protein